VRTMRVIYIFIIPIYFFYHNIQPCRGYTHDDKHVFIMLFSYLVFFFFHEFNMHKDVLCFIPCELRTTWTRQKSFRRLIFFFSSSTYMINLHRTVARVMDCVYYHLWVYYEPVHHAIYCVIDFNFRVFNQ